jgi:hypothetical protein
MRFVVLLLTVGLFPSAALCACGEKGGPGYRGPNNKCVGWAQLGRVCGTPPETHCTPEEVHKDSGQAAKDGADTQSLMENAHREKR